MKQNKNINRKRRRERVRAKIVGTAKCPRLNIFRSNQHIYAQLIDDEKGKTILSVSDKEISKRKTGGKIDIAKEVGILIAKKAMNLPAGRQVEKVVFDRGNYKYHGRVKSLAEGARQGGFKF